MLDTLINISAFLLVLTPIVFIHELGHFWAARRAGITVEVFSVGFGSELLGFTDSKGTRWKFSAIPLGGYVKMVGEHSTSGTRELPGSFSAASLPKRALVVAMGPIANFLLGIGIFAVIFMVSGKAFIPPVIGAVAEGSAAEIAGLYPDDQIIEINGYSVKEFRDIRSHIVENPGREINVVIMRRGNERIIPVTPAVIIDECAGIEYGQLGVSGVGGEVRRLGIFNSVIAAGQESYAMSHAMLRGLGRLVSGRANKGEIGGPIKIAEISGMVAKRGVDAFFIWAALLSINLGLVNLLPVPVLDGGHLVLFGIEAVMRRPLSHAVRGAVTRTGMALLLTFILLVTVFDILSIIETPC